MKLLSSTLAGALAIPAGAACAADAVTFPGLTVATSSQAHYTCKGGHEVTVSYVNASNGDSFAYLPIDGTQHVFVGVMSGSGARYASGRYVWWSKGNTGMLIVDADESAPPLLAECVSQR